MDLSQLRKACFEQTTRALQSALTPDQLMIQANETVRDLRKITNMLAKRLREWSGGFLPELDKYVRDHEKFTQLLATKSREEILRELDVVESIGTRVDDVASATMRQFAQSLMQLYKEKAELEQYIENSLAQHMPNTLALCGSSVAAELLTEAGSLQRLATLPSGTVQLLGAETALFRHLRNKKHRPPKHGVIFNHQLIQHAKRNDRGRAARALADKIAISARVDYFKGEPCGAKYRKDLEARFL